MTTVTQLFDVAGLAPHGYCISWTPWLLRAYVVSDLLIAIAYYSIPIGLAYFVWHRQDLKFRWIYLMFSGFILACGTTHLIAIVLMWYPVYWLDVGFKAVTAALSIITAGSLIWIIPRALKLPSPQQLENEIQERRQIQENLQVSESNLSIYSKHLATLIETIPDAIVLKDGAGRWLVTNAIARDLFQLHGLAWEGKTSVEMVAIRPEICSVIEGCITHDELVWNAGKLIVFEKKIPDIEGSLREVEIRKVPFFSEDGSRKGMVTIARDITGHRLAEHELRIADTAFEAQEGIIITDANNHIVRVNRAFTRLTGYSLDEVLGKTPAILKSGRHDHRFYQEMWETLNREKFWQGEVWDRRKNGQIYPKWLTINAVTGAGGEIRNYVGAFTDLSQHKEAEEAIYRLAYYDPLTDLPNRRLLRDRLQVALQGGARDPHFCAILLVDLDNFKTINDTKGHEIGDQLLIEVAQRLKGCVRLGDTVARLGGDEFVVMLDNLSASEAQAAAQAENVGEKILEAINRPYLLSGQTHYSSPSIGITLFSNNDTTTEEVLKRADSAMYQAKNRGRNAMCFFDPELQVTLEARMLLESDLRDALERQQFRLYYQPQVDQSGRVFGAEVLLRWEHPVRGLVPPSEVIPVAEETGLILDIGEWVLHTACRQLKAWEAHPELKNLVLAVNVSARQFRQPGFVQEVCEIVKNSEINPNRIKLELTESLVLHNIEDSVSKMQDLREYGIRFSMDDFGTGYSSLSYLKKLPLSQLKIDQSFVRDIATDQNDAIIASTIIGMAHNLRLSVIAEGVETEEQKTRLAELGCLAYQGYLFGRPIPIAEFELQFDPTRLSVAGD